jgi:thiamine kinase-like enzyme
METEVESALSRIDLFKGLAMEKIRATRLGGLTNRNYEIQSPVGHFVLRIPGEGTGDIVDRGIEEHNARVAAEAGVNAELLFFEATEGTMLCRYVERSKTMSSEGFKDLGAVERAASAFRRLHTCGHSFRSRFELFEQIDNYLGVLKKLEAPIPDGYAEVQREAEAVRNALGAHQLPSAPCHCDPLAENFLDVGDRMFIVDFEYSGNNDPMWDLGDLSVEAEFDEQQDEVFLNAYFDGPPPAFDAGRMVMYKAMCDLLWTLWGVVQFVNDNPAEDFWAYSVNRLNRCRALMSSDAFPKRLEAVRRGPQ